MGMMKLTSEQLQRIEAQAHESAELIANCYCDEDDTFTPEVERITKGIVSLVVTQQSDGGDTTASAG